MIGPSSPKPRNSGNRLTTFLLVIGLIAVFVGAVTATLVLVLPAPDESGLRHEGSQVAPPAATGLGEPAPATPTEEYEESDSDYEGGRLPAGAAIPLSISQRKRNELAAAASTAADGSGSPTRAGRIISSGTIWYGKVYGSTPDKDTYYVVASLDSLYFWTLRGDGPWKYEGVFDARKCGPSIPRSLTRAWGTGGFGKRC